jgi:hypothetical protein
VFPRRKSASSKLVTCSPSATLCMAHASVRSW